MQFQTYLSDITESNTIYDSASPNSDVFFDGPYYIGSDDGASAGNLAVGDTATYLAFYRLTQGDVDAGGISNSATATATSSEGNITDISDDGDTVSGDTGDDPTTLTISPSPSIDVNKSAEITTDEDGTVGVGDTITYTIEVTNTGNVSLN